MFRGFLMELILFKRKRSEIRVLEKEAEKFLVLRDMVSHIGDLVGVNKKYFVSLLIRKNLKT